MTVYADVLFLVNFLYDAEIIAIVLRVYAKRARPARILLSACIGGLQGVLVFIPYFKVLCAPPARLFVPLIMTAAVFCPCTRRELLGGWLLFAVISFLFSGAIAFFEVKAWAGLLFLLPIYGAVCFLKKRTLRKNGRAILIYKGKKICETGFFDSGNLLSYCGTPVILANSAVFGRLFGKGFSINAAEEWADSCDLRLVPYTALGKSGFVRGIRIDCAVVDGKRYDDVILGFCEENFSDSLILNGAMI